MWSTSRRCLISFTVYIDDLIRKLVNSNLGCCVGTISICCLLYADDIVLLTGSLHNLQLMLDLCTIEMTYLDLQFNSSKCHVLRIGKHYGNKCNNVFIGDCPIAFTDSITYLGTLIRAGRTWRTDSSHRRRQFFGAFNSIYCKSVQLSEPAIQQLVESFCKPVLLYNLVAVNPSQTECSKIEYAWNTMMYKIYGVSGESLKHVYLFTKCLPIRTELLLRQLNFFRNCVRTDNKILRYVYECYGETDVLKCITGLGIVDLDVNHLSSAAIRNIVFDSFVRSCD